MESSEVQKKVLGWRAQQNDLIHCWYARHHTKIGSPGILRLYACHRFQITISRVEVTPFLEWALPDKFAGCQGCPYWLSDDEYTTAREQYLAGGGNGSSEGTKGRQD